MTASEERPVGRHVMLMDTFLCDAFYDGAAKATVEVLEHLAAGPDTLTSGDMSCLMHLTGLARAQGRPIRHCHAIEILRDTMPIPV